MIDEVVKENWIETASEIWCLKKFSKEVSSNPSRAILLGFINIMFSRQNVSPKNVNLVDLSSVENVNFFDENSNNLILLRLQKSIDRSKGDKLIGLQCLKEAYLERFDINVLMPKEYGHNKRPPVLISRQKPECHAQDLASIWAEKTCNVYDDNIKLANCRRPQFRHALKVIENIIKKLEQEFGEVSYRQAVYDDEVIEAIDTIIEKEKLAAESDKKKNMLDAIEIGSTRLPEPL